jgi:hypothetical protein
VNDPTLLELATIAIAVLALVAVASTSRARERTLEARVQRMEARLYRLMRHSGVPDPADELEEARRLAKDNDKRGAITEYRRVTGASEADAAKVVEGMLPKPAGKK